jgi:aryl-alcohol dehydrogenase-like predicted oxidoreductase
MNDAGDPIPIGEVARSVEESIDRLGFVPNLYLIHNPFVARPGELKAMWKVLEDFKSQGKLKSIGVSNFRPQDLEEILDGAEYKPVINQVSEFVAYMRLFSCLCAVYSLNITHTHLLIFNLYSISKLSTGFLPLPMALYHL